VVTQTTVGGVAAPGSLLGALWSLAREELSGWLDTVATWNPVTYLLEGLRSLIMEGWVWDDLLAALGAIAVVGAVSMMLCFGALRGRIRRG
jgi:ABC-2 type transport system permease protein